MKKIFVQITDTTTWKSYIAQERNQCKDRHDKEVFDLVVKHCDSITLGCIIGDPIWGTE